MNGLDGLSALISAHEAPLGLTAPFTRAAQQIAIRYSEFIVRALSMGLTLDQAKVVLESEGMLTSISGRKGGADARLEHVAQHGYMTVLLGEVLTKDELASQAFGYATVLNSRSRMQRPYGKHFAQMSRERQRSLVMAAVALTEELGGAPQGWPLERAMAAVMPHVEDA